MTWNTAKATLKAKLEKEDNASEVEIDGHRVRKRSVAEMAQLDDFFEGKASNETATPNLKKASFRVSAYNNGSGLV